VLDLVLAGLSAFCVFFQSRLAASLEVLALRRQVAVLERKRSQPPLNGVDRFFRTTLRSGIVRAADFMAVRGFVVTVSASLEHHWLERRLRCIVVAWPNKHGKRSGGSSGQG
jgi:hypothetical protein